MASYQQSAQLHKVKHVALVHLGQLLAQLNGFLPHLKHMCAAELREDIKHADKTEEEHSQTLPSVEQKEM